MVDVGAEEDDASEEMRVKSVKRKMLKTKRIVERTDWLEKW